MPTTAVYLLKGGTTKRILEHTFDRVPEKGEFIALDNVSFVVDEVWHVPHGISPTTKLVVSETEARPPR